ncbi:TfoX/Sxy family transcriptional regulator of competence genes [Flavobacterium sp. 7E]|uniref:TfoX/Sxy family protein n=1 Tax=unclassified Flavobacterium TaxID=196869 RepID=UPI00156FE5DD|nr:MULTISPECIES: TfoX/Sxy family protein [unclassified Flavobacterium]MBE0391734.1 hypothetical protein [Flavobacterium sp. PL002]NRS87589.1 TfoX/Sxy family transcriptional regulator of competence genes [Flavobacterium sp. 7E]NRT14819.1 TfoX/Sxy family transcriptional regulator of competence genes [Flavobacterium sp. 28A]
MPYNELLSLRIEKILIEMNVDFKQKKMFGGNTFMVNDKMCFGIMQEEIMLRVMDEFYETLLEENHVKPMDFTKKIIKGFLFIEKEAFKTDNQLLRWINYGLDFSERGILKHKKKK